MNLRGRYKDITGISYLFDKSKVFTGEPVYTNRIN